MKHSLKKLVTVILLMTVISCTKEPLHSPSAASIKTQDNATQKTASHSIGERFGGGIIFFLGTHGTHGLIADTVDLPPAIWWNGIYYVTTGATLTGMRGGPSNTRKIILAQGTSGSYAALECVQSTRSGYTDWFLPSIYELNELYYKGSVVGGFTTDYYWSSSEYSSVYALRQNFDGGDLDYSNKVFSFHVRAIRAF